MDKVENFLENCLLLFDILSAWKKQGSLDAQFFFKIISKSNLACCNPLKNDIFLFLENMLIFLIFTYQVFSLDKIPGSD